MRDQFNRVVPGEHESVPATCWLIEYIGAIPVPVYMDKDMQPTADPWAGKKFTSMSEAYQWMHQGALDAPWKPIEHTFILGTSAMNEPNRI